MSDFIKYVTIFREAGGIWKNVQGPASHWLYGTLPTVLAELSKRGLVPNPPGHNGGRC